MTETQAAMGPTFEAFGEDGTTDTGFEIIDPIDRHRYTLRTSESVAPSPAGCEQFPSPVDAAVTIRTSALTLPNIVLTHVRDVSGEVLASTEQFAYEEFTDGIYTIELHTPIKIYLRIESAVVVRADFEQTVIEFDDVTTVTVGARSYHQRPAATVMTTSDPEDVMAAVSTFGSALKTTSPERAFPTLRGHPPAAELGEELSIPDELVLSDNDITIELPPELEYVYPAAPLAYYLGAELVPGEKPRLHAGTTFEHTLDSERGFEHEVERILKQTFFLDCMTRTEGLYKTELHERRAFENDSALDIELDFAALYDASPAERLATYLDIPFEVIESHLPDWKLTTHIQPIPASVETLPFVVNDLAIVRTAGLDDLESVSPMEASGFDTITAASTDAGFTRGGSCSTVSRSTSDSQNAHADELYVRLPSADSHEQAWIGEGVPVNASKATTAAYHNRLDRTLNEGNIGITVVCNDAKMGDEREVVRDIYGTSANLPFDVTVLSDLTRAELQDLLATSTEFLHYVGHIDDDGFACADGKLDATALAEVNVDAFLLNTCHSYEQGMALIEAGAIGGIVTLNELFNHGAVEMGCTLARLLNAGFPLRNALEIARESSLAGKQYLVVGDGGLAIGQPEGGCPGLCEIERTNGSFHLTHQSYATEEKGMGTILSLNLPSLDGYYLSSTRSPTVEVAEDELDQFLSLEDIPVRVNKTLRWSSQIDLENL